MSEITAFEKKVNELLNLLKQVGKLTDELNSSWCLMTTDEQNEYHPLAEKAQSAIKDFKRN